MSNKMPDRGPLSERLGCHWFHFRKWLRRCPECHARGFYPHTPRWENDRVAQMLGIADKGCARCGKGATT